jgi:hypothetical protein
VSRFTKLVIRHQLGARFLSLVETQKTTIRHPTPRCRKL